MLTEAEAETFMTEQHQASRWTYLGSGMTHENFVATIGQIAPAARGQVLEMAPAFC